MPACDTGSVPKYRPEVTQERILGRPLEGMWLRGAAWRVIGTEQDY
jgi:hypothetical protein